MAYPNLSLLIYSFKLFLFTFYNELLDLREIVLGLLAAEIMGDVQLILEVDV